MSAFLSPKIQADYDIIFSRISAGNLLYFSQAGSSPFFADTGIDLVYLSAIREDSFVVKRYIGTLEECSLQERSKEIPFRRILEIRDSFPLAPARIFTLRLQKD